MASDENKLGQLLSSPDAMEKILSIVQMLGASGAKEEEKAETADREARQESVTLPAPRVEEKKEAPAEEGIDVVTEKLGALDPVVLSALVRFLNEYGTQSNTRESVLLSIKPYLRDERQVKVEKAARLLRMAHLAHVGFKTFLGGGDDAQSISGG